MKNNQFYNELRIRRFKRIDRSETEIDYCFMSSYCFLGDLADSWYWTLKTKEEPLPKGLHEDLFNSSTLIKTTEYKHTLHNVNSITRHKFKTLNRNLKYRKTLGDLQEMFFRIMSKYRDIKIVNEEGIVVSNFYMYRTYGTPTVKVNHVDEIDENVFTIVKYFTELQNIGFNDKIPAHILNFIEKQNALEILEY
jgi:hypothetical protein